MVRLDTNLVDKVDSYRMEADKKIDEKTQAELGQFMTPNAVASFMASLFEDVDTDIALLDAGAGVGSLTAAFVQRHLARKLSPPTIFVDTYEIDSLMLNYLEQTMALCRDECQKAQIHFAGEIINQDFIQHKAGALWESNSLFSQSIHTYTHCIMNPPYKKIRSDSAHRVSLRQIGIETSNLYSAFLALAIKLLAPQGQLVAIIPRSFCNGVYFKPFRQLLLSEMAIRHLHIFDSRTQAFKDSAVLQENVILYAVKDAPQGQVCITASSDPSLSDMTHRTVSFDQVVKPHDLDQFIHIATTDFDQMIVDRISVFTNSIHSLGLDVSTGPVVDFRLKDDLRQQPEADTVPLIYPAHFCKNQIEWPVLGGKKPNAIRESEASRRWLMPNGWYVLTRRFSSKEERRRIVAAICDPQKFPADKIGFENHINVFHQEKKGIDPQIAKGLALYLNSTLVDLYFRQFSGHTQVNATDLRTLYYPSLDILIRLGSYVNGALPNQSKLDELLDAEIDKLSHKYSTYKNPMTIQQKLQDALDILDKLGMPRAQKNERSALALLALLDIKPSDSWQQAGSPLMGITPIMDFVQEHYARSYAPNTRETFRRQTMHQFVDAGIAVPNPDQPDRPINSPKWVYQIEPNCLALLQTYDTTEWGANLQTYLIDRQTLKDRYAQQRKMEKIPLVISEQQALYLTPSQHSELIRDIIQEFGPRFVPGNTIVSEA